jgi:hypothetical protein
MLPTMGGFCGAPMSGLLLSSELWGVSCALPQKLVVSWALV